MIDVESRAVAAPDWEALVEACGGNVLHLPAVHAADHDPRHLLQLLFRRGGEVVACATAFAQPRRAWHRLGAGPETLLLPTAPAIARAAVAADVHAALIAFARERGFGRLVIQPASRTGLEGHELLARYATTALLEFVIDLTREPEEILLGMHKIHRKNVRRAARSGLTVEEDDGLEGLLCLRDMQLASAERAAEREHGFSVRDASHFRKLHQHVYAAGIGHLLFASHAGERVAALAYLVGARRALTVRSGSLPLGYETRAMYLLLHELIRKARGQGVVTLNIGGVPREAADPGHPQWGLYEFKKGFGGTACLCTGVDLPLRESVG